MGLRVGLRDKGHPHHATPDAAAPTIGHVAVFGLHESHCSAMASTA
jgi:hypothetical protein